MELATSPVAVVTFIVENIDIHIIPISNEALRGFQKMERKVQIKRLLLTTDKVFDFKYNRTNLVV